MNTTTDRTQRTTQRTTQRAGALLALALVPGLLGALGACGVVDRATSTSSAATASSADPVDDAQPSDDASAPSDDETTEGGGTAPQEGQVVGTGTGQLVADPTDTSAVPMRLDVTSVDRLPGEVVEVRFVLTNTDDSLTWESWTTLGEGYDVSGAALLDLPDDKRYLTLLDTADVCLCTTFTVADEGLAPGESMELYAQFPAPPESTTTVDFALPGFAPISGLEIG